MKIMVQFDGTKLYHRRMNNEIWYFNIIPILFFICLNFQLSYSDDEDIDFELKRGLLWDKIVMNEIEDVVDVYYEVGKRYYPVPGTSECDSISTTYIDLTLLYYRKSMKGLSKLDLQN